MSSSSSFVSCETRVGPTSVLAIQAVLIRFCSLPAYLYNRLQSVLNAAARSIAGLRRSDHTTSPTHSPVSTGWRSRSVFSLSWRQSSIVHWTVRLLATWLQIYAVCLICRPDDVWDRHSLTSSMSVSRSVQHCWRPSFRCGWCSPMEQSATWHRREWHTVTFPSWTQNIFI